MTAKTLAISSIKVDLQRESETNASTVYMYAKHIVTKV